MVSHQSGTIALLIDVARRCRSAFFAVVVGPSLLIGLYATGLAHGAVSTIPTEQDGVEEANPDDTIPYQITPPFAWNRTDRYEPPDFEAFFPDDSAAGKRLDEMLGGKLKVTGVDQRLALIRRGLRNMSRHRTTLLGQVGNMFVWNKKVQDPRAIELLYHASASDNRGVAHYALYHGPTVVAQRTPNLVRMLMERYRLFGADIQHRIAWGMKTYGDKEQSRRLLLDLLKDHEHLESTTIGAALVTYESVFDSEPPDMDRFEDVGLWLIAYHRTDLSADHPRAAEILREMLDRPLHDREDRLLGFVTRVDDGHETAVALVRGVGSRNRISRRLSRYAACKIDFDEMFVPQSLTKYRLREFARHLPSGMPNNAKPAYTRPPLDAKYAYRATEFVAPHFETFFPNDQEAGQALDAAYAHSETINLTDEQLLDLYRRGFRCCSQTPNAMFGWISTAFGWPPDPRLTEILYQAADPDAPIDVRKSAIYYGFGLGTTKTKNVLRVMWQNYMAPPFDRRTNSNFRTRILWGVRDHEDDKHDLATYFATELRNHATLSDQALQLADRAYRQLAGEAPPNAAEYASRGIYVAMVLCQKGSLQATSQAEFAEMLTGEKHVITTKFVSNDGQIIVVTLVCGQTGLDWLVKEIEAMPETRILFADLLTEELVDQAKDNLFEEFREFLGKTEE